MDPSGFLLREPIDVHIFDIFDSLGSWLAVVSQAEPSTVLHSLATESCRRNDTWMWYRKTNRQSGNLLL